MRTDGAGSMEVGDAVAESVGVTVGRTCFLICRCRLLLAQVHHHRGQRMEDLQKRRCGSAADQRRLQPCRVTPHGPLCEPGSGTLLRLSFLIQSSLHCSTHVLSPHALRSTATLRTRVASMLPLTTSA